MKSHKGNKFLMYSSFLINFSFLSILRSISTHFWIFIPLEKHSLGSLTPLDYTLQGITLSCNISCQITLKYLMRFHSAIIMWITAVGIFIQVSMSGYLACSYLLKFPPKNHIYSPGGVLAIAFASISLLISLILFVYHIKNSQCVDARPSLEEKTFETSSSMFVWYISLGGFLFSAIEKWSFEVASEFCLMTLLTIGYGDIVPKTTTGKGKLSLMQ
jgi:hypothetical protein